MESDISQLRAERIAININYYQFVTTGPEKASGGHRNTQGLAPSMSRSVIQKTRWT